MLPAVHDANPFSRRALVRMAGLGAGAIAARAAWSTNIAQARPFDTTTAVGAVGGDLKPAKRRGVAPTSNTTSTTSTAPTSTSVPSTTTTAAPSTTTLAPVTPSTVPPTSSSGLPALTPEQFGACGDGTTDDTAAIQRACDQLAPTQSLVFAAGRIYPHSQVISIRVPSVRLRGPGTLLATNEQFSAVRIAANDVTLDGGLVLRTKSTTVRWSTPEASKLHVSAVTGATVRSVVVDGSASAGVFIQGASAFLLEDVEVRDSRADGIHNTGGAHDGVIRRCSVTNSGDDGFAVVSYQGNPQPCHHISFEAVRFYGNTWGRGFSVVGGHHISFSDLYGQDSDAAMLYIGAEGAPWYTYASSDVAVRSATFVRSNRNPSIDHGAVLVYLGAAVTNDNIEVSGLAIRDTRSTASRQIGLLAWSPSAITRATINDVAISGGPAGALFAAPAVQYNATGLIQDGRPLPPHVGW